VTAPVWRTASACANGNCLLVAHQPGEVWVRDSKLGDASPVLRFTAEEFEAFADGVRRGEFTPTPVQEAPEATQAGERCALPVVGPSDDSDGSTALSALRRVRELHQPMLRGALTVCRECSGWDGTRCLGVLTPHPCPTLAALEGADTPCEVEVIEMTVAEYDAALANDLANLGCTYEDLEAMAVTGVFASPMHRRLWLLIKPAPKETPNA
jgi:hypothetical protein